MKKEGVDRRKANVEQNIKETLSKLEVIQQETQELIIENTKLQKKNDDLKEERDARWAKIFAKSKIDNLSVKRR